MIHLVTAVSRPEHLKRIHASIVTAVRRSTLDISWILVVDDPKITFDPRNGLFPVRTIHYPGGPCPYGIAQKNFGIDQIDDGFYHCLDDDNLVHPLLFERLEKAMSLWPSKLAFVVGQERWDQLKTLVADPDRMEYGQIDNTMFVVHKRLIGASRYDRTQAGREDYIFFRNLWNTHRGEFIFVKETLSYYNYIRIWPVDSPHEPIKLLQLEPSTVDRKPYIRSEAEVVTTQAPSSTNEPPPAPVLSSPPPRRGAEKRIALYSSKRERCGIATYASALESAFLLLGHDVRHYGSQRPTGPVWNEIRSWKPDVFHIQHEPSIMPPEEELVAESESLRSQGAKIHITLHTETPDTIRVARRTGRMIVHRPAQGAPDAIIVPMPCTNVGGLPARRELRKKFGFPEDAFLISTVGFMIPWKDHSKIAGLLLPWILSRPEARLQVIASEHWNEDLKGYAQLLRTEFSSLQAKSREKIRHVDSYPSDLELIERLWASDLGYVWCPFDTGSCSAAAAQFTSARCPLVASDSSHYSNLGAGVVRAPKGDMRAFIRLIEETASNPELLADLREKQAQTYRERNYLEIARRHVEIYEGRA